MTSLADFNVVADIKDGAEYTYFKLQTQKLTINRKGKDHVFRRGDPLGWRLSSKGTHIRLISPLSGPGVVFSLLITDESLKWLDKQDPKAKTKRIGMKKSDKPEDSQNKLEGFVVTDGKWFFKLAPEPIRTKLIKPRVLYERKYDAESLVRKFKDRNLSVKEVWTKDLGKEAVKSALRGAPSAVDLFEEAVQVAMEDGDYQDSDDKLDFVVSYCEVHYGGSPHYKSLFKDFNDLTNQAEKFLKGNTASVIASDRLPGVHPAAEALFDEASESTQSRRAISTKELLDAAKRLPAFKETFNGAVDSRQEADAYLKKSTSGK